MSNNLVNQSTKAISTNELRSIGPVLAVMSSGLMDLFLAHNIMSVASLCNHDLSVIIVVGIGIIIIIIVVICEHSS